MLGKIYLITQAQWSIKTLNSETWTDVKNQFWVFLCKCWAFVVPLLTTGRRHRHPDQMGLQPRQAHAALPSQILFQATRWKREQQDALSRPQLQVSAGQRSPPSCSVCSGQSRVTKGTMKTIKAIHKRWQTFSCFNIYVSPSKLLHLSRPVFFHQVCKVQHCEWSGGANTLQSIWDQIWCHGIRTGEVFISLLFRPSVKGLK